MPLFAECAHDPLLVDWRPTAGADRNVQLVLALNTIKLTFDLTSARVQFDAAQFTVEMIRMVDFVFVANLIVFDRRPLTYTNKI